MVRKVLFSVFNLLVILYSLPLGLICLGYFALTTCLITPLFLDIAMVLVAIYLGVVNFNPLALYHTPGVLLDYYSQHGLIGLLIHQCNHWQLFTYQNGTTLLLVLPLGVRIIDYLAIAKQWQQDNAKYSAQVELAAANLANNGTILSNAGGEMLAISDAELNHHALVVGSTGVGKTTTMFNFVASYAKRNLPVIYLDGKGSIDLIAKISAIAKEHNRVFKVFMLRPEACPSNSLAELAGYNPLASGNATEWKNRIMSLFTPTQNKGQEHFALAEGAYINLVVQILYESGLPIDLKGLLVALENPLSLINLAREVNNDLANKLIVLHNDTTLKNTVSDVGRMLELFVLSNYGYLFDTTKVSNVIKLCDSIAQGEIVLFLFDASAYPDDTSKLAKMVINDINSCFANFAQFTQCLCVFDEFASYASSNLADSISLHRSKGLHALVGTQSITTVKFKGQDTARIAEELLACCNTYIIHRLNHAQDAEMLASVIGKHKTYDVTTSLNHDAASHGVNRGSARLVDTFKISPDVLKELAVGEAIVYRKATKSAPRKVKIIGYNV